MTQKTQPPVGVAFPDHDDKSTRDKDPAEIAKIEADIDQTRNAISGDLRTLGERLSPERLEQKAKEVMTEAKNVAVETLHEAKNVATSTYREVKDDAMETVSAKYGELRDNVRSAEREAFGFVRENAVPLALIGIGVAWFVSNRRSHEQQWDGEYAPRGQGRWRYPEPNRSSTLDDARQGLSNGLSRAGGATRDVSARARDRAKDWVAGASDEVNQVADQVRDFASREVEEVRGVARDAQQKLGRATNQARDFAGRELRQARDFSRRTTDEHPLAVGAAAVAAGVCIGLLIPETQRESQWMGTERERLFGDAKEAVHEVTHAARETARDVKNSVKNSLSGATS
jgi:ElaB/YqjD/DUF883 family membrane-anchored ribosome-binding protein